MEHLEGRQTVHAALLARQRRISVVLIRHGIHAEQVAEIVAAAEETNVPVRYVDLKEIDAMSHSASHGGVLAVASPKPRWNGDQLIAAMRERPKAAPAPLLLLLEGIDDARNLGFTLRSAEAFGADAVLIKKHLWDFDAVEVARPSSGAYERIQLAQIDDIFPVQRLQSHGMQLIGCIANARRTMYESELSKPTILAIGGEKRGLSGAVRSICDALVTIPTRGQPSSLALSHAAAVVLAEANRQRTSIGRVGLAEDSD